MEVSSKKRRLWVVWRFSLEISVAFLASPLHEILKSRIHKSNFIPLGGIYFFY
jgi:hypothetical protein